VSGEGRREKGLCEQIDTEDEVMLEVITKNSYGIENQCVNKSCTNACHTKSIFFSVWIMAYKYNGIFLTWLSFSVAWTYRYRTSCSLSNSWTKSN
jgi:hypothetical protein